MGKYREILEKKYIETKEHRECAPTNKLQYIGSEIFDFTTYDNGMDELFAKKMLDVIICILNRTTFDYMDKSDANYENYLLMINMPFMEGKLDWGTSIRGAWFDEYGYGKDKDEPYKMGDIEVPKKDIKEFMDDLYSWGLSEHIGA